MQPPPLSGIKVIELAGLAPVPYCGLLLADYGASVLRIDRAVPASHSHSSDITSVSHSPTSSPSLPPPTEDKLTRRKTSLALDLKNPKSHAVLLNLLRRADMLLDPYRPGVLEALGLDPTMLLREINPRLIVGRLTGFPRPSNTTPRSPDNAIAPQKTTSASYPPDSSGPSAAYRMQHLPSMAGHDINYLACSGVLSHLGPSDPALPPSPPLNTLADFAGGGLVLFSGVLMALLHRATGGGRGQVVEANMLDGVAHLGTFLRSDLGTKHGVAAGDRDAASTPLGSARRVSGLFGPKRGQGVLGGACPFYKCYTTRDRRFMAVGALEDRFFAELGSILGLDRRWLRWRHDTDRWQELGDLMQAEFRKRSRDEWAEKFDGSDACCTPVLEMDEVQGSRPLVTLRESPGLAVGDAAGGVEDGQGPGMGKGWSSAGLRPGEGGEETLRQWMGWEMGRDFDVREGMCFALKNVPAVAKL